MRPSHQWIVANAETRIDIYASARRETIKCVAFSNLRGSRSSIHFAKWKMLPSHKAYIFIFMPMMMERAHTVMLRACTISHIFRTHRAYYMFVRIFIALCVVDVPRDVHKVHVFFIQGETVLTRECVRRALRI